MVRSPTVRDEQAGRSSRRAPVVVAVVAATIAGIGLTAAARPGMSPRTASGTVYHDLDRDGVRDRGEPGLADIVVVGADGLAVTDDAGRWRLAVAPNERVRVLTGWHRSQCDDVDCGSGPGPDQDFAVKYQTVVARTGSGLHTRLDVGLIPDWPGGYPIPDDAAANGPDVAVRTKYVKPSGPAGSSECFRTDDIRHRACAPGDRPVFLVEISNEGTTPLVDLEGHVELPSATTFVELTPSSDPPNHPALTAFTHGDLDPVSRRVPFAVTGSLPPGGVALYRLVVEVTADARPSPYLQVAGEYPNPVGSRVTSVWRDAESTRCTLHDLDCPWGVGDRQQEPDNSDRVGFAVVAGEDDDRPPPEPAPAPPTGECAVSAILEPTCGVWLGASTPSRDGRYDYERGLAEYESVAANAPDILHFYKRGGQRFPHASEIAMAERDGEQRALLLYNWKPSMTATWAEIASGAADREIDAVAGHLRDYPHRLFLDIFHEPEDNVRDSPGSGMTVADYVDMYRYVVDRLRANGVDNVVYVWNPMGYHGWRDLLDGLYPGDGYVDWICYDPYARDDRHPDLAALVNSPRPGLDWPGFYRWATAKAPGKPLMLCEWGIDVLTNTDPGSVLDGDIERQLADYPALKALVYWNDVDRVNARIDLTTERGRSLGESYRRFANLPIFNTMPPDVAFAATRR